MNNDSLAFLPAIELSHLIKTKQVSPVELIDLFLNRIETLNPKLNAFLTVNKEQAMVTAREAEKTLQKEKELPPLFGIPLSIKDLTSTRGIRTTYGSLAYVDFVPDEDTAPVERLIRAGAIILGKTNTPEFGLSPTTENNLGEDCRNPWNTDYVSGGSSGGSAVSVAAGMAPMATGTDGGGSVRIPASFCGIYGIKPTKGRVPATAGFNGMPLFSALGPLTRTVVDAALMLNVIAGPDPRDPTCLKERPPDFVKAIESEDNLKKLRIAWSPDLGFAAVEPEVASVTQAAALSFEAFGCSIDEASPNIGDARENIWNPIAFADTYAEQVDVLKHKAHLLTSYVKANLETGERITGAEYSNALKKLWRFQGDMEVFFNKYDLLLTPTLAVPAFPRHIRPEGTDLREVNPHLFYPNEIAGKQVPARHGFYPFTYPFNITGQPAASVPCGFSKKGLPIGLQIVGRIGEDATVLQASAAFERAHPWSGHRLPLS